MNQMALEVSGSLTRLIVLENAHPGLWHYFAYVLVCALTTLMLVQRIFMLSKHSFLYFSSI